MGKRSVLDNHSSYPALEIRPGPTVVPSHIWGSITGTWPPISLPVLQGMKFLFYLKVLFHFPIHAYV